jgi:hypothetical protein
MNNEDIVAAFRLFEADQPVEDYEAFGFQVWPVLRNWLGFQLVFDQKGGVERKDSNGTFLWRRFLSVCSMIGDSVRYRIPVPPRREGGENAGETVCRMNAIILTDSNRCFMRGGRLFHYIADPAVQELGRLGVAAVVWDMGQVRSGKRVVGRKRFWVRRRLDVEIRRGLSRSRISGEFAQWEKSRSPCGSILSGVGRAVCSGVRSPGAKWLRVCVMSVWSGGSLKNGWGKIPRIFWWWIAGTG